jgi:hypothetical protein
MRLISILMPLVPCRHLDQAQATYQSGGSAPFRAEIVIQHHQIPQATPGKLDEVNVGMPYCENTGLFVRPPNHCCAFVSKQR